MKDNDEQGKINLPKISIAIITYNQFHHLEKCIKSIEEQDYERIQIIIVDDYSCDWNEEKIIEMTSFSKDVSIIRMEKHSGPNPSYQKALDMADGEYILFLGGDDKLAGNTVLKDVFIENKDINTKIEVIQGFDDIQGLDKCTIPAKGIKDWQSELSAIEKMVFSAARPSEQWFCLHSAIILTSMLRQAGGFDSGLQYVIEEAVYYRLLRENASFIQSNIIITESRGDGAYRSADLGNLYLREGYLKERSDVIEKYVIPEAKKTGREDYIRMCQRGARALVNRSEIEYRWYFMPHKERKKWIKAHRNELKEEKNHLQRNLPIKSLIYCICVICCLYYSLTRLFPQGIILTDLFMLIGLCVAGGLLIGLCGYSVYYRYKKKVVKHKSLFFIPLVLGIIMIVGLYNTPYTVRFDFFRYVFVALLAVVIIECIRRLLTKARRMKE